MRLPSLSMYPGLSSHASQKFYDPVNEKFFEPKHTGISYSFTEDGHFEEAYYRAVANRTAPSPPKAPFYLDVDLGLCAPSLALC